MLKAWKAYVRYHRKALQYPTNPRVQYIVFRPAASGFGNRILMLSGMCFHC